MTLLDDLNWNHLGSNGRDFGHRLRLPELHSPTCSHVGNVLRALGGGLVIEISICSILSSRACCCLWWQLITWRIESAFEINEHEMAGLRGQ